MSFKRELFLFKNNNNKDIFIQMRQKKIGNQILKIELF